MSSAAGPDQAEFPGPQLTAGEHDGGVVLVDQFQGGEHARGEDGQAELPAPQRLGDGQRGAAGVQDQSLVETDQVGDRVGDVAFLLGGVGHPRRERRFVVLALERDGTADHPPDHAERLQCLHVASDRHLGHVEFGGEFAVAHFAFDADALFDAIPPRLGIHAQNHSFCGKFTAGDLRFGQFARNGAMLCEFTTGSCASAHIWRQFVPIVDRRG